MFLAGSLMPSSGLCVAFTGSQHEIVCSAQHERSAFAGAGSQQAVAFTAVAISAPLCSSQQPLPWDADGAQQVSVVATGPRAGNAASGNDSF